MNFKMSLQSAILWADEEIIFLDFCSQASSQLPCIILVQSGFFGFDDYKISSDEMFFVYGFKQQKRVVAKDKKGRTFSFPVNYNKAKFQSCSNAKGVPTSMPRSLESIVYEWTTNHNKRWIMVADNKSVVYNLNVSSIETESLGILELREAFELKYVLTYAMCADISTKTTAIPVFMDISVSRGVGAIYTSKEYFESWVKSIKRLVNDFSNDDFKLDEDIILFENYDFKQNGSRHYEYLKQNQTTYEHLSATDEAGSVYETINEAERKAGKQIDYRTTCPLPYLPRKKNDQRKGHKLPNLPPILGRKAKIPTPVSDLEENDGEDGDDKVDDIFENDDKGVKIEDFKNRIIIKSDNEYRKPAIVVRAFSTKGNEDESLNRREYVNTRTTNCKPRMPSPRKRSA